MTWELAFSIAALVFSIIAIIQSQIKCKKVPNALSGSEGFSSTPLRLQAYERLIMLCERINLPNLISRLAQPNQTAIELQVALIETIKQEYNYNVSQQIYVSQEAWEAVETLKNQNILFINKTVAAISPTATGSELSKKLLQDSLNDKIGSLYTLVRNALNEDAKKLMQ